MKNQRKILSSGEKARKTPKQGKEGQVVSEGGPSLGWYTVRAGTSPTDSAFGSDGYSKFGGDRLSLCFCSDFSSWKTVPAVLVLVSLPGRINRSDGSGFPMSEDHS